MAAYEQHRSTIGTCLRAAPGIVRQPARLFCGGGGGMRRPQVQPARWYRGTRVRVEETAHTVPWILREA